MKKKIGVGLALICLLAAWCAPGVFADGPKQLIYDYAGALTDSEAEKLQQMALEMGEKKGLDIIILFVKEGYTEKQLGNAADDFYDEHAFGYDKPHGTGVLLAVDLKSRKYWVSTSGGAETYFTDSRLSDVKSDVRSKLSDNEWYKASREFINYMKQFRDPNLPVTLTDRAAASASRIPVYLVIAVIGSGVSVLIMVKNRASKVTVNANTYLQQGSFALVQQDDVFMLEYTTRTRIPRNPPPGRGGGGGNSTHHVSSGGFSHGGSGGSF